MYGYGPRHAVGFNPFVAPRRGRAGVSLLPQPGALGAALSVLGQFATAQGGNPALLAPPAAAMRGTREPIGFPSISLAGVLNQQGTSSTVSQGIFRPSKLVFVNSQDSTNASISVTNILIGSETAMVNSNPVIGSLFLATAVECGVTFPTAGSGITIAITFQNNTTTTTTVFPTMLGEYIRGGGLEIGG
jgi:hypothetical protein